MRFGRGDVVSQKFLLQSQRGPGVGGALWLVLAPSLYDMAKWLHCLNLIFSSLW